MIPRFRIMAWKESKPHPLLNIKFGEGWVYLHDKTGDPEEYDTYDEACDRVVELLQEDYTALNLKIVQEYPFKVSVGGVGSEQSREKEEGHTGEGTDLQHEPCPGEGNSGQGDEGEPSCCKTGCN